jgi:exonuclease SbcD
MENASFDVVSWKVNRAAAFSAENFSDDTLESVDVLDDEEIFRRLLMSKLGVTEANDEFNKDFEKYLPLFKQVVEEVDGEEA